MNADDQQLSVNDAAKLLNTTPPTIRKLIDNHELDGQITRGHSRSRYVTNRFAVDEYLRREGPFPHRRSTHDSRLRSLEDRLVELAKQPPANGDSAVLREVIRAQNAVIEHLNQALAHQERATEHLREAELARADAVSAMHNAEEAQRSIVALYGMPDDASDLFNL